MSAIAEPVTSTGPRKVGSGRAEMVAGDVVRLVLAAEPFEVIVRTIAEGLARVVDAGGAWLLGVDRDGTTARLAAWDPADLAGIPVVRRALDGAPPSTLGGSQGPREDVPDLAQPSTTVCTVWMSPSLMSAMSIPVATGSPSAGPNRQASAPRVPALV